MNYLAVTAILAGDVSPGIISPALHQRHFLCLYLIFVNKSIASVAVTVYLFASESFKLTANTFLFNITLALTNSTFFCLNNAINLYNSSEF